jgi:hypothetical protein
MVPLRLLKHNHDRPSTARKASPRKSNHILRKHSHVSQSHYSLLTLSIFGWLEVLDLDSWFVFLGLLG